MVRQEYYKITCLKGLNVTTTEIYSKANPEVKRKHIEDASRIRDINLDYSEEEKEELLEWLKNSI